MPELKKKDGSLLTLEESHLEMLSDVLALSDRIGNLWKELGVLKWNLQSLEELLIKNKPFLTSSSQRKRIKTLHRHLTILEKRAQTTANGAKTLDKSLAKSALTAGSL